MEKSLMKLDGSNFITDPEDIARNLFMYTLYSYRTQSNHFSVTSLPSMLQLAGDDSNELISLMTDQYTILYTAYFDKVNVQVTDITEEGTNKGTLYFECNFTKDSTVYDLGYTLSVKDNKVMDVIELNNTGNIKYTL